ncbi:transthyretin [Amylocystis lapponica]|nr:transthyretin [Amylocystis lapponica]
MSKSPITCHVLDSSLGKPPRACSQTDADGRCMQLFPKDVAGTRLNLEQGRLYKVVFKTKEYFERTGRKCFYPWVEITFEVANPEEHYHIPLLISPYSFTTYRGS